MNDLIYYNEQKTKAQEAECLYAGNFLQSAEQLSLPEKKARFAGYIALNPQTRRSAVSLVVEFVPGEKLPNPDLIDIARDFMDGIGFGRQPYLVYRHDDTHHQHMHIISTKIEYNGGRIPESFIGVKKVQPTRKVLEQKYHLATRALKNPERHDPREKIRYGEKPTWQSMADTLQYVLDAYCYRSLPELDAALRLYNLTVKAGAPGTRLHTHRGILYQVLDEKGKPRNAPIKASELPFKATLAHLETRFASHRTRTTSEVGYIRYNLDKAIDKHPVSKETWTDALKRQHLAAVPAFNKDGTVKSLYVIDLETKTVLSPVDLGSNYTAAAIRDRLGFDPFDPGPSIQKQNTQTVQNKPKRGLRL